MIWADWNGCTKCSGFASAGSKHLLAWFLEEYPQGRSQGIYNCRNVSGTGSLSIHSCGRANDLWLPYVNNAANPAGYEIIRRIGPHGKRLGIQAVIFDRTIWSARSPGGRPYTGIHPHFDHLHIELTPNAATNLNLATLRAVIGTNKEVEGDEMAGLRPGDRNNGVKALQIHLNDLNPLLGLKSDGVYGTLTRSAVAAYQTSAGFPATGEADLLTLIHLYTSTSRNQPAFHRMLNRLKVRFS